MPVHADPVAPIEQLPEWLPGRPHDFLLTLEALVESRRGLELEILGYVRASRSAGASWAQLGRVFGVSAQAVHKRYSATDGATGSTTRGGQGSAAGRPKGRP